VVVWINPGQRCAALAYPCTHQPSGQLAQPCRVCTLRCASLLGEKKIHFPSLPARKLAQHFANAKVRMSSLHFANEEVHMCRGCTLPIFFGACQWFNFRPPGSLVNFVLLLALLCVRCCFR